MAEQDYRRTVIAAYEEVENALVNLDAHRQQNEELQQQVDQLEAGLGADRRPSCAAGMISQLEVFETERSLLAAQLALLASHQQVLTDTVTLYKALGGGWAPVEVANAGRLTGGRLRQRDGAPDRRHAGGSTDNELEIVLEPLSRPELGEIRVDGSLFAVGRNRAALRFV